MKNHGKKAIVMGASSGIGRAVAERLLAEGWTVGVAARRIDALQTIGSYIPNTDKRLITAKLNTSNADKHIITSEHNLPNTDKRLFTAQIDITHPDADKSLRNLIDQLGGLDLYFHSSGIGKMNLLLEPDIELNTVSTNAMGFTRMVGEAFRYMANHGGGHIAVISSIAGVKGLGPAPSYSATKAFNNTYIQALEQLANSRRLNIRFTDIRPGFVDTALISGSHFPLTMRPEKVADDIMRAIHHKCHIRIIDWRWRIIVSIWRRIPRFIWRHFNLLR